MDLLALPEPALSRVVAQLGPKLAGLRLACKGARDAVDGALASLRVRLLRSGEGQGRLLRRLPALTAVVVCIQPLNFEL
jgi:hypothetical protein